MKYAIDIYAGDDWGTPVNVSGYDYDTFEAACGAAERELQKLWDHGERCIGATIVSDRRVYDDDSSDPVVEEDISPLSLGWEGAA